MKSIQHVRVARLCADRSAERLACVFVELGQHLVRLAIAQLVVNKVDRPDVVRILWPLPDHRGIMMIEPPCVSNVVWEAVDLPGSMAVRAPFG